MEPISQTMFSVTLFLALSSLLEWAKRRNRGIRSYRVALQAFEDPKAAPTADAA